MNHMKKKLLLILMFIFNVVSVIMFITDTIPNNYTFIFIIVNAIFLLDWGFLNGKSKYAQKKAQKRYDEKNREKRTYLAQRSTARGFIRNKATLEDLEELKKLIEERKKSLT